MRLLGKPAKHEWPEETVAIKWNSFDVINQVRIDQICPNICENAIDLIMSMLTFNPNKRITALEALNHPYFKEEPMNT
ncbi:hypothetical protein NQ318_003858 [Aromia moschata]|uniref:Protein kinase domain-containing protein n=1 Tax=Aromia moschata TaxID=1265417 RepID=A0AAV8Z8N8_9CUCU|nr:hypothetical protein NQ318_003858 [Aromia moschata]